MEKRFQGNGGKYLKLATIKFYERNDDNRILPNIGKEVFQINYADAEEVSNMIFLDNCDVGLNLNGLKAEDMIGKLFKVRVKFPRFKLDKVEVVQCKLIKEIDACWKQYFMVLEIIQ